MKTWKKLALAIFAIGGVIGGLLVVAVAALIVPPATGLTITPITATFSHSGDILGADPEDDLFIYVEEYASPFRINRAAEAGFLDVAFVEDVQPGEQIEIYAFKRYLPRERENSILLGSIPTWTVVQDGRTYIPEREPGRLFSASR